MKAKQLIGLFGGTFDPIHQGHIQPIEQSATELGMEQVFIIPCHIPPHKQAPGVSAQHRLNMLKLAIANTPLFALDDYELRHDKASYTLHTLQHYRQKYPLQHLCFFIGMDSLLSFTQWYEWQQILQLCHLVVCHRPGYSAEDVPEQLKTLLCHNTAEIQQQQSGKILLQQVAEVDISSSQLRQLLKDGKTSLHLCDKVQDYIRQHALYSC